MLKTFNPWPSK